MFIKNKKRIWIEYKIWIKKFYSILDISVLDEVFDLLFEKNFVIRTKFLF